MGNQDTFSKAKYPVLFGLCDECGGKNFYSENRFKEYQEHFTALCTGCLLLRRFQRTAALERPIVKATAPKV